MLLLFGTAFLLGVVVALSAVVVAFCYIFRTPHELTVNCRRETSGKQQHNQYEVFEIPTWFSLPKDSSNSQSLQSLNLLVQFLFQELKDTQAVRRWVKDKLTVEFKELMERPVAKLLIRQIQIVSVNLGSSLPVANHLEVTVSDVRDNLIQDLQISTMIEYEGCWSIVLKVNALLGAQLKLHVKLTKISGPARLQFSRHPYTHWSFAFTQDPVVELEIESYLQDTRVPHQITHILRTQLLRMLHRKHTLPNYRMRVKPFFERQGVQVCANRNNFPSGKLCVSVKAAGRLSAHEKSTTTHVCCSLKMSSKKYAPSFDANTESLVVTVSRPNARIPWGFVWRRKYVPTLEEDSLVVGSVSPGSFAQLAGLCQDDIIVCINGNHKLTLNNREKALHGAALRLQLDILRNIPLKESPVKSESGEKPTQLTSRQRSSSVSSRQRSSVSSYQRTIPISLGSKSVQNRTKLYPFHTSVKFNETFQLSFTDSHHYLCVFLLGSDDQGPESVLAYTNISLADLLADCAAGPTQGDSQLQVNLLPLPNKLKNHPIKESTHIGFIKNQCFGDLTLQYSVSEEDYSNYTELSPTSPNESQKPESPRQPRHLSSSLSLSSADDMAECTPVGGENCHRFAIQSLRGKTNYCNYCSKKIWFKTAYQCAACSVICHKKCMARCTSLTLCTPGPGSSYPLTTNSDDEFMTDFSDVLPSADRSHEELSPSSHLFTERRFLIGDDDHDEDLASLTQSVDLCDSVSGFTTSLDSASSSVVREMIMSESLEDLMANTAIMSRVREKGRELYSGMLHAERKALLEKQVTKFEQEIDLSTEYLRDLFSQYCDAKTTTHRESLKLIMKKEEEKEASLQAMLVQYTCGLQDCLEKAQ